MGVKKLGDVLNQHGVRKAGRVNRRKTARMERKADRQVIKGVLDGGGHLGAGVHDMNFKRLTFRRAGRVPYYGFQQTPQSNRWAAGANHPQHGILLRHQKIDKCLL